MVLFSIQEDPYRDEVQHHEGAEKERLQEQRDELHKTGTKHGISVSISILRTDRMQYIRGRTSALGKGNEGSASAMVEGQGAARFGG